MVISQLPKIEIPSEDSLNNEDREILDAFKILLNGYQRSQGRLRAVTAAFAELESIARSLLKECRGNDKPSPKKQGTPLSEENNQRKSSPLQLHGSDSRDDILMVDLTSDFQSLEKPVDSIVRETSPVFGQQRKRGRKKGSWEETAKSVAKVLKEKIEATEAGSSTKGTASQEENLFYDEGAEGNEENRSPICNTSFGSSGTRKNDSTLFFNESKPVAKIGLTKTVYTVDQHRTPSGKRSKQSTLILQPLTSKIDLSCSEKPSTRPSVTRKWPDLFDENYRNAKKGEKNCRDKEQESHEIVDKNLIEKKSEPIFTFKTNAPASKATPGLDNDEKPEVTDDRLKEESLVMETPSQIDETARSLFEDEELEDFEASKDLLNTCIDSPVIRNTALQPVTPKALGKRDKSVESIASTSKVSQSFRSSGSIDETFFAPGEIEMSKSDEENMEMAHFKRGCYDAPNAKDSPDKNQKFKRKSGVECRAETAKESGDFGVQDIDWDVDISNDNWQAPKRPLNDSFDVVPGKKKKSPNYAYKGKVERNQAERGKLRGWDCKECEKYYENMNLTEKELKMRINRCSRHRSKYKQRCNTPKDFWNPGFPDATDSSDFSDDEPLDKQR